MMNLVFVAAFIAACGAAKLDRTYLPPSSSQYAGGAPGSLQPPFISSRINGVNQGISDTPFGRTSGNNPSQGNQLPSGSYENEHQGVVVEAAAPGTRASNQPSGLGGPRENYGSTDSKVGEAAFRGTKNQAKPISQNGLQSQQTGSVSNNQDYPDLSAFYQPPGQTNTGYRPGNPLFADRVSNTIKYHMNIGLNKFNYGYETENGIKMEENGVSSDGVKMQGGYSYTGDDGKVYSVVYTADKNGYRPMGSHLPTPPPIPAEILESLRQNARDEANGINDDGSYDAQKYNTEDDYTQSDTNDNYNDRQSNKFGERPGSDAGAGAAINQYQQSFVRPNVQGQFNSYDFPKDSSSTQFDSSKFGTGVGFDNRGQSTKVKQPGFNADASAALNERQSVRPNLQDQLQQTTHFNNRFGVQSQYLPPAHTGIFLDENSFQQIDSSKVGYYNNFINAQPQSGQNFQKDQGSQRKPVAINESNSHGTSNDNNQTQSIQGSNSFSVNSNNISPQNNGISFQTTIQNSIGNAQNAEETIQTNNKAQSQGSLSIPILNLGITSQNNVNGSPQNQDPFSQSFGDNNNENTNLNIGNRFSPTFSSQNIPATQPDLFLTTPLENQEQQPTSDTPLLSTSSINIQPQKHYSGNSQSILTSNDRPSDGQFNNNLPRQPQRTDNSYIYNKPSKPFSTPSKQTDFNNTPVNTVQSFGPLIPNTPELAVFFTQFDQSSIGTNKHPQPIHLTPITSILTAKDDTEKNTYQNNGITQASISSFPSITPTSSSQTSSGKVYEYTRPVQGLTSSSQEQYTSEINRQSSAPSSQKENTIRPHVNVESNTQFGQRFPTSSNSVPGQLTLPSRFGIQTSSTFAQKPSHSQFGVQGTTSIEQIPTLSPISAQTSSFEQKPIQQQFGSQTSFSFGQQTTPSPFSAQTSSSFGQKETFSQFSGLTSTSLNQQTTPTHFGFQTSSSYGQKQTNPPPSFSFGQQTTPTRFGVQSSSLFEQNPTLSPFGTQTYFGQKQPHPQTSFLFGEKTTPSRFGAQTSSIVGQSSSQLPTEGQNSFSFGSQTIPLGFRVPTGSSFGHQTTNSIFEQKSTRPQLGGQTSTSFGLPTIPSRFGGLPFGQLTTPSSFNIQSSLSSEKQTTQSPFGVQPGLTFGQKTTPSRFSIQSSPATGQQTEPPYEKVTSSTFGQKITFTETSSEQISTTQIGDYLNKQQQSQSQESNEKSENQSDFVPSTLQPASSFDPQNSQESVENTSSEEIYQYNKPTIDFTASQQSQGGTQSGQHSSSESDEQDSSSNSQSNATNASQVTLFPRFPEQSKVTNSPFVSFQSTTFQSVAPTVSSNQSFDSKESTTPEFSSTSSVNFQYQPPTVLPSSQEYINLQKQESSQNSQQGELYQYDKPSQSHLSQSNVNFNAQSPPQSDEGVSQTEPDNKSPSSSTLGILPSSHPFPQLSFYSACCRAAKPQNSQTSQSDKISSTPLTGNLGSNNSGFINNGNQDKNVSGLKENIGNPEFGVQKDTPSFAGKGEQFGGPRKPPKFDETGYHY